MSDDVHLLSGISVTQCSTISWFIQTKVSPFCTLTIAGRNSISLIKTVSTLTFEVLGFNSITLTGSGATFFFEPEQLLSRAMENIKKILFLNKPDILFIILRTFFVPF